MTEYCTRKHFIKRVMSFFGVGILWLWGRRFITESKPDAMPPGPSALKAKKAPLARSIDV